MIMLIAFTLALITNFLKNYLTINTKGHLNIDWREMKDVFKMQPMITPSVGFMMGILAFNTTLNQVMIVPEIVQAPKSCLT